MRVAIRREPKKKNARPYGLATHTLHGFVHTDRLVLVCTISSAAGKLIRFRYRVFRLRCSGACCLEFG